MPGRCPAFQGRLLIEKKEPSYLSVENFVHLQEHFFGAEWRTQLRPSVSSISSLLPAEYALLHERKAAGE